MATLEQKIKAERRMRDLIEKEGLPEPDRVEYGYTCIRLFWDAAKAVIVVDIDPPPDGDDEDAADAFAEAQARMGLEPAEGSDDLRGADFEGGYGSN
jgi:hypothetical protein